MADLTGPTQAFHGNTTIVDTVRQHKLGTKGFDNSGNEYIYLQGIAATAQFDVVTYDELFLTALAIADAIGPVAVAQAAITASEFGWYLIKGTGTASSAAAVADDSELYLTAVAGEVDDADVAGDLVIGMWSRSVAANDVITAQLDYPKVHNVAID